jgi:hypothetical protein
MLKYKASDIVKRAKDIADLRGTDFVTYSENISLLNECWIEIYNKLINSNDKTFLKQIELSEGENELPEDFYILEALVDIRGQPVTKFTVGMYPCQQYYELVNNKLILNNIQYAKLYYYPEPDTITLRQDMYTTGLSTNSDYQKEYQYLPYFYQKETGKLFTRGGYVLSKDDNFSTVTTSNLTNLDNNSAFVFVDTSGNTTYVKTTDTTFNVEIDGIVISTGSTQIVKNPNCVIYHSLDEDDVWYMDNKNQFLKFASTENLVKYFTKSVGTFYTKLTDDDTWKIPVGDGHIFSIDKNYYYLDNNIIERNVYIPKMIGTSSYVLKLLGGYCYDVNFETGYGAFLNKYNTIYGVLPDTELNFPNNIYYTLLSYKLAYAYACKQSKDTAFIEAQLSNAWEIFYNSKQRDGFGTGSIINIYHGGY